MDSRWQQLLAVGLGGSLGAIARYVVSGYAQSFAIQKLGRAYPFGTLLVNVAGCFLIGILMGLVLNRQLPEPARLLLVTGFLGSLTTFSTFGYETVELLRENDLRLAFWNIAANVVIGLFAVWLGLAATKVFGS